MWTDVLHHCIHSTLRYRTRCINHKTWTFSSSSKVKKKKRSVHLIASLVGRSLSQRQVDVNRAAVGLGRSNVVVSLALLGLAPQSQEGNLCDSRGTFVVEDAVKGELAVLVLKVDEGVLAVLVDGHAVIEVQLALGVALDAVDGDEELKVLLAQLGSRVGGVDARGDDDACPDEERDGRCADVLDGVGGCAAADGLVRVPVEEEVVGEVDVYACGALLRDGGDDETRAVEVLVLECPGRLVVGVDVQHGQEGGRAVDGGGIHGTVDVVEETVADGDGFPGAFCDRGPAVEFLGDLALGVVVAVEGGKGAEGSPSRA